MGQQGADQVNSMIENANRPGAGIIATIIGVVVLLIGASGVFTALQDSLNTIWEVKVKPGQGIMGMIKERFLSFTMILAIGFLLLVSMVVTTVLSALARFMVGAFPGYQAIMQVVNFLVSFLVITFLFALIFKYLPDAHIAWKDALIGAAVTSLLFTIGKMAIGIYLGKSSMTNVFGVAGSLILILVWIYYSGMILFLGAEFTQVYANRFGHGIQPAENAVAMTENDRVRAGIPHATGEGRAQPQELSAKRSAGEVDLPVQVVSAPRKMPSGSATGTPVPVTGEPEITQRGEYEPRQAWDRERLLESLLPAAVAFLIGISGSLAIAREQRKRPVVRNR
jgi:membrane protein